MNDDRKARLLTRLDRALADRRQKRLADAVLTILRTPYPWQGRAICCGRDDGVLPFETWDEADAFRRAYVEEASDHDRAVIVSARA